MQACPNCGEQNAETARFCSACGAALVADARTGEERKVVSVLFVDLVGFTARSDRADPEDVRAMLRVYHERLKREIERFGGTVEKFVGDAVMAVFGAPVAHEDDAKRAVLAALRILTAIDELNEEHPELELAVRGAVNTGEAVVALGARPELGEAFVTGDVVNVASRLQGEAPVGSIVVGEITYRATRDEVDYEACDPVEVKGKTEPLPLWRAVSLRSSLGVDVPTVAATPLIGREHELTLMGDLFRRVMAERSPHLVTLSGEPGVGKSRLVQEFLRFVDDLTELVYWRQGRCLPYGEGITFWALGEIVKSHAGILESDPPEDARSKLTQAILTVVEAREEQDWLRARLAPLVGLGGEGEAAQREESFTAWTSFLEAIAAKDPLVVVIEDLHWADPAMLAFIEHLADWPTGVPLFVLCTARPELYEREPGWGGGKRNHTAVSLSPLSPEETARLISSLLDQSVLPSETQSALLAQAGGNPLYAEEFIRMLIDRGILVRRGVSWELAGEGEIPVPENVQSLIAARLDTLPPERKTLLQDAAVIGKVFWSGALAEMGSLGVPAVRDALHELAQKELVRPARRPSIEGEAEYAFWHVLIRDVAYGQIPRAARAAKHRAAAVWIERIAGDRLADSAELLAYHYERALEFGRASGDDVAELESAARRFLMLAADQATRLDVGKVKPLVERALALTAPGDPERIRVLVLGGRVALWSAIGDSGLLERAVEEARASNDALGEAEALGWLSRVAWGEGDTARQLELVSRASELVEGTPPGHAMATVLTRVAAAHGLAGRSAEALAACERALPVVQEFGTQHDLAVLLQWRGHARIDFGEIERGFDDMREGLRLALESSPAGFAASAYVNLGDNTWFVEGPASGQALYEEAADLADRRGAPFSADWARMQGMWTRYDLGDWDGVLEVGDRVLDESGEVAASQLRVLTQTYRQDVLLHRGAHDREQVETLLQRGRAIRDGQVVVPVFRVAALARVRAGDPEGALALVEESDGLLRGFVGYRSWVLDAAAPVCLASGAADVLGALIDQGIEFRTRDANSVMSARAALAEIKADHERALERYEEAAIAWEGFPSVLEHGHALAGAGRSLLALGRTSEAATRFREARARYASLGAAPFVAEIDALLERATAKSS